MLELEAAREAIFSVLKPMAAESVPLAAAAGRILAEDVLSLVDLPVFDNSAMDGYAVRTKDVAEASAERPVSLRVIGLVAAGGVFRGEIPPGGCVRIFTGSPLPANADAVVMQEDTRTLSERPEEVLVCDSVKPWENLRLRGEDLKVGAVVGRAGERVTPARAGLLAATGAREVRVARRPCVGILATGTELVEPGKTLEPGQIYESNRTTIEALAAQAGAQTRVFPLVMDTLPGTEVAFREALSECDAVVTSGGVSVGEFDFVQAAWKRLGGSTDFWRVAIKPGKPFLFGRWDGKLLFGLPGNPVSAFVTFVLLVRPTLLRWQRATEIELPIALGRLAETLTNRGDRRHFMRVILNGQGEVRLAGVQASHVMGGLAHANGLVDVAPNSTLEQGALVNVMRLDG